MSAIKEDPRLAALPVIFVTASADQVAEVQALSLGAVDYLTRPVEALVVKARVHNQIALRRVTRALMIANGELRRLASTDPLTGAANRRRFFERTREEQARAGRHQIPVSLALLDIDHFKRINDTHGHEVGDYALRHVVEVL